MNKFIGKKLGPVKQTQYPEGLTRTENRPTKYGIVNKKTESIVLYIPDWYQNPLGIAKGLAVMMNRERKIILPLDI